MNQSRNIIAWLRELNGLETLLKHLPKTDSSHPNTARRIETLRAQIPTSILTHYDHRKGRGKKGVAPARGGVCGACHLTIPVGQLASLRLSSELNVCGQCGVFLFWGDDDESAAEHGKEPVKTKVAKPVRKTKSSKRVLASAA